MSPMDCGRRTEGLRLYQFIIIIYHSFIAVDKVERGLVAMRCPPPRSMRSISWRPVLGTEHTMRL